MPVARAFQQPICSHTPIVKHHPRSGNFKVQTGEDTFNFTKARVSRWAHGNRSCEQREGSPTRIPNHERVRLAREQCGSKGAEITSNLWAIEFGRSRTRIKSVGDTLERRTTLLISEAEVVIHSRQHLVRICAVNLLVWIISHDAQKIIFQFSIQMSSWTSHKSSFRCISRFSLVIFL